MNIVHPHSWVDYTINIHHNITYHCSPPMVTEGLQVTTRVLVLRMAWLTVTALSMRSLAGGWGLSIKLVVGECAGGGCARTEAAQPWAGTRALYTYSFGVQWGQYTLHSTHSPGPVLCSQMEIEMDGGAGGCLTLHTPNTDSHSGHAG